MPEVGIRVEQAPSPEFKKASTGLMLHLVHGESDGSKTAELAQKPKPTEVAQHTFDVLNANNQDVRKRQQEAFYENRRKADAEDPKMKTKIPAEVLKEAHFHTWAMIENARIKGMFEKQNGNLDGVKAIQKALRKVHLTIDLTADGKVDARSMLQDQLYLAAPVGHPGKFYQEFCTGNMNQKLLNALDEQDIVVLKDFLVDTLGSSTAYDAFLATKQTQDALKANTDFSSGSTTLSDNEKPILAFLQKGEALLAGKPIGHDTPTISTKQSPSVNPVKPSTQSPHTEPPTTPTRWTPEKIKTDLPPIGTVIDNVLISGKPVKLFIGGYGKETRNVNGEEKQINTLLIQDLTINAIRVVTQEDLAYFLSASHAQTIPNEQFTPPQDNPWDKAEQKYPSGTSIPYRLQNTDGKFIFAGYGYFMNQDENGNKSYQPLAFGDFRPNGPGLGTFTSIPLSELVPASQTTENNITQSEKDVFENEAATNSEAHKKLMGEMLAVLQEEKNEGKGKLQSTIQETAQGPDGQKVIHDGYVVYLPAKNGERIVTIGDIHGDLATIKQILEKEQFFEDMASTEPKIQLVFQGDLVDRGPKSVEVMTAIMKLKTLYKGRVHIIAADHDTTKNTVSSHDFPDKLNQAFKQQGNEIYQEYTNIFNAMPKMIVAGNGIVIVHGGPAAEPLTLAQIGRLEDTDTDGRIGEQFSWSDPIAHPSQELETKKQQSLQTYEYMANWAATQPNITDDTAIKIPGTNDAFYLKDIKKAVEMLKALPPGAYPNPDRVMSGLNIDALFSGLLSYDQRAFDVFMQRIGGKIMVRGHQVSDEVDGSKPNMFQNRLWTIHSTGTGSSESYYSHRENHPAYAVFDLGNIPDLIDLQANIKPVW